nr:MAG TPA: hypothetical protein [Caudoviricetes sp.]
MKYPPFMPIRVTPCNSAIGRNKENEYENIIG